MFKIKEDQKSLFQTFFGSKKKRILLFQNLQDRRGSKKFVLKLFGSKKKQIQLFQKSLRSKTNEKAYYQTFCSEEKTNLNIPKCHRIEDKTNKLT